MNDLNLCLEVVSTQGHVNHCVTFAIEAWFQRTTIGNGQWGIKWSCDRWRHLTRKVKLVTRIRLEPNISKIAGHAI